MITTIVNKNQDKELNKNDNIIRVKTNGQIFNLWFWKKNKQCPNKALNKSFTAAKCKLDEGLDGTIR